MYSSFRVESAYGDKSAAENNTGLSWSYWRVPHVASTVYCALALMYDEGDDDLFNPYAPTVVARTDHTLKPLTAEALGYGRPYAAADGLTPLPAGETVGLYYGFFLTEPDWFREDGSAVYQHALCVFLHITQKAHLQLIDKNPWLANQPETTRANMLFTLFELLKQP
jgi:hypothetical protein